MRWLGCSALIGALSLVAASQLAVALVNWLATLLVDAAVLPRMDFSAGIPPESRTLVVVPTMLSSAGNVEDLVEALEVRFLANRDEHLHFGLLTDFRDAHEETHAGGRAAAARWRAQGIEELNDKYAAGRRRDASSCSTGRAAGIRRNASGWATSASAASSAT